MNEIKDHQRERTKDMNEEIKNGVTVTVPAVTLRKMIKAVLPHVSRDDTLPALRGVRFEVRDGMLLLTATDRYTMGIARYPVPGGVTGTASALLVPWDVKALRRLLAEKDRPLTAAVTIGPAGVAAECGALKGAWFAPDHSEELIDLRRLARRVLAGEPAELGDSLGLDPRMLRRFTSRGGLLESMAVRVVRPVRKDGFPSQVSDSPLVVLARGDWFLGLLMPMRITANEGPVPWDDWSAALAPAADADAGTAAA